MKEISSKFKDKSKFGRNLKTLMGNYMKLEGRKLKDQKRIRREKMSRTTLGYLSPWPGGILDKVTLVGTRKDKFSKNNQSPRFIGKEPAVIS